MFYLMSILSSFLFIINFHATQSFHLNINFQDPDGTTALIHAVCQGHFDIVSMLLDKNADVNIHDSEGKTALIHAVDLGYDDIAESLIVEDKSDTNIQDSYGCTALIYAVQRTTLLWLICF